MRRFSGIYPRGGQGAALFLMRAVVGVALLIQGKNYLFEAGASGAAHASGLVASLAGILLIVGLVTPFTCAVVMLGSLGVLFSFFPPASPTLFDCAASDVFTVTLVLGILVLGPGAASVDARLFGRREVIFPPLDSEPKNHQ